MSENFTVDRAAELWDDFARQFMQINPGIHFTTAQSPEEREAVYRARFAEVIRNGWAAPAGNRRRRRPRRAPRRSRLPGRPFPAV
jgi:hypothetical protein